MKKIMYLLKNSGETEKPWRAQSARPRGMSHANFLPWMALCREAQDGRERPLRVAKGGACPPLLRSYKIILILTWLFFPFAGPGFADWQEDVKMLLVDGFEKVETADIEKQVPDVDKIASVAGKIPSWQELYGLLRSLPFSKVAGKGELILNKMKGTDGVERPWVLYVPETYDENKPAPMLVVLHGGVSHTDISENQIEHAQKSPWLKPAKENGWFVLFPFGQSKATWWDAVGMANIRQQIRTTKAHFNINDDKVFMAGFSDGASAGFLYAMVEPGDFGAIVALNGHMGVGSLDGDLPTYASNMTNTPIYAVTTENDALYPSKKMSKTIEMAMEAGADILYRQLDGTHSFDYGETEIPKIVEFIERNPRNPLCPRIYWETGDKAFGRCHWFSLNQVLPTPAEPWHKDYNSILISDGTTIGFMHGVASDGVLVNKVMEDTFAEQIKLQDGDIVIAAGGVEVKNIDDLDKAKQRIKRGESFDVSVRRASETIVLKGIYPAPQLYNLFKREAPSAAAKLQVFGNKIVIQGSRVGEFKILFHPDLFNLEKKIEIVFNGKTVLNGLVSPDLPFMLKNFMENRDRKTLYVAQFVYSPHLGVD